MILVWLYFVFLLIRPQDAFPVLSGASFGPLLLVLAATHWAFSRKDLRAPQIPLMVLFYFATLLPLALMGLFGALSEWSFQFGKTIAFFLFLSNVSDSVARLRIFLFTLLACAVFMAFHGIYQFHNGGVGFSGVEWMYGRITWVGFYADPNDLGLLLVCTVPIAAFFVFHGRGGARLVSLAGLPLLLYAIYLTQSRGALLATLTLGAIAGLRRLGTFRTMLLGLPVLAVVLSLPTRIDTISVQESSAQGRVYAWYAGFRMFFDSPIVGVGPERFGAYHPKSAHNAFVLALAETGIIGYLLFMMLLISSVALAYWMSRRRDQFEPDSEARKLCDIGDLLFLILVSWTVGAFFLSVTFYWTIYTVLALCTGLYLGARKNAELGELAAEEVHWFQWFAGAGMTLPLLYLVTRVLNQSL